jgi:hypothetical protein
VSEQPCTCGRAAVGPYSRRQCRPCWLALNDGRYQRAWGLAVRPPCPHEGPVMEAAVCQCADPEARHVRHCLHPAAEHGRCTRGPCAGTDPDVRSCAGCPLRRPDGG